MWACACTASEDHHCGKNGIAKRNQARTIDKQQFARPHNNTQVTGHRSLHPSCHLVLARPSGRTPHSMRAGHSKARRATLQAERRPQIPHHFAAESYWRGPIPMPTIIMHMSRRKTIMHVGTLKTYKILQTALLHHAGNICADHSKEE